MSTRGSSPLAGDLVGVAGLGNNDVSCRQQLGLAVDDMNRGTAEDGHALHFVLVGVLSDGHTGTKGMAHIGPALALQLLDPQQLLHHDGALAAHAVHNGGGDNILRSFNQQRNHPFLIFPSARGFS